MINVSCRRWALLININYSIEIWGGVVNREIVRQVRSKKKNPVHKKYSVSPPSFLFLAPRLSLLTSYCLLGTVYCLLFTSPHSSLPPSCFLLLTSYCLLITVYCLLPPSSPYPIPYTLPVSDSALLRRELIWCAGAQPYRARPPGPRSGGLMTYNLSPFTCISPLLAIPQE
jgi:hypothetical protein